MAATVKPPQAALRILDAGQPLRNRAPIYDDDGRPLSDFMVIFPGLKSKPRLLRNEVMREVHRVLSGFSDTVVFAEFNTALNVLWVSIRPMDGARFEISAALRSRIPSARLVSHL
jgi:hypothetical protein